MVILVILHQHSLAGSIMGLLDLDWYSKAAGSQIRSVIPH